MFGDHDLETARAIAKKISARVQAHCEVFKSKTAPTKFTIGVPTSAFTLTELKGLLTAEDLKRVQGTKFDI